MPTKFKIVIAIVVLAATAALIFALVTQKSGTDQGEPGNAVMGQDGELQLLDPSAAPDGVAGGHGGDHDDPSEDDGTHGAGQDVSAQQNAAVALIREYVHYDHHELAEARSARLAPLAAPASSIPNLVPALAQEEKWGYVGFDAQVRVVDVDASVSAVNEDQTQFQFTVLVHYTAEYTIPTQKQVHEDRKTWTVWINIDGVPLAQSIGEPALPEYE